jgi:hypothetical protein
VIDNDVSRKPANSLDDENGNCKLCGHPIDLHIIICSDTGDFSKDGEMALSNRRLSLLSYGGV